MCNAARGAHRGMCKGGAVEPFCHTHFWNIYQMSRCNPLVFRKVCLTHILLRIYSYIYASFMNETHWHLGILHTHTKEPEGLLRLFDLFDFWASHTSLDSISSSFFFLLFTLVMVLSENQTTVYSFKIVEIVYAIVSFSFYCNKIAGCWLHITGPISTIISSWSRT